MQKILKRIQDRSEIRGKRYRKKGILEEIFFRVLETPHFRCNSDAPVEIHTLTAHHHLLMYLTAIKSFLRYYDNVAIVVHDDGSLTRHDIKLLNEQIHGIRIIDKKSADRKLHKDLAGFPYSRKFRRQIVNSMELFDNILLSKTEKIITMNSDVLFLKEPTEVIDWICCQDSAAISVYEEQPAKQKEFLSSHSCTFPPHVTICLTCFHKDIFDGRQVENILSCSQTDWYTGQNVYPILFRNKMNEHPLSFLDKDTYQASGVFNSGATFRHYWTSTGFFTNFQIEDSAKVLDDLLIRSAPILTS
jgi:hypothetical protein